MLERGRSNLFGGKTLRGGGRRSGLAINKKDGQVLIKFRKSNSK